MSIYPYTYIFLVSGALRSCEYLSSSEDNFCATQTLLWSDVELRENETSASVFLTIKQPKERRFPGTMASVELVQCDSFFCPVQALVKYKQCVVGPLPSNLPVFRLAGVNYTSKTLNSDLKYLLQVGCVSFIFCKHMQWDPVATSYQTLFTLYSLNYRLLFISATYSTNKCFSNSFLILVNKG